jgi:hypothetical protein
MHNEPNNPGTGRQVGLFSRIATGPERRSTPGRTTSGGEYALLGTDVSDHRDCRRRSWLWRRRGCCGGHRKDTVFHLLGRLRDNADNWFDGQKKSAYLDQTALHYRAWPGLTRPCLFPMLHFDRYDKVRCSARGAPSQAEGDNRAAVPKKVSRLRPSGSQRPTKRMACAGTEAQLRILRQGLTTRRGGCPNLFLRVHILRRVRREGSVQRLSELRRRVCAAPDPAGSRAAARGFPCPTPGVDRAGSPEAVARRGRGICPTNARYWAGKPLSYAVVHSRLLDSAGDATSVTPLADELTVVGDAVIGQIEVDAAAAASRGAELSQPPSSRLIVSVIIRPSSWRAEPT